jgi:hypothetical protein
MKFRKPKNEDYNFKSRILYVSGAGAALGT